MRTAVAAFVLLLIAPAGTAQACPMSQVSTGGGTSCGIRPNGSIQCWGRSDDGRATPPSGSFVAISVSANHSCAIRADGRLSCWGLGKSGETTPPDGVFRRIATSSSYFATKGSSCGIRDSGRIVCWGDDEFGQASPPPGKFVELALGREHGCAVRSDGAILCWGGSVFGKTSPPAGSFVRVAVSTGRSCAIRSNGTLECWGIDFGYTEQPLPAGSFVSLSGGPSHQCGIDTDGRMHCWGLLSSTPPAESRFQEISVGDESNCGVLRDGNVECWDSNSEKHWGEASPPAAPFVRIASGTYDACALRADQSVLCFGANWYGSRPPATVRWLDVAMDSRSCGLRAEDRSVECFGEPADPPPPPGAFAQVSLAVSHGCGVRDDGSVECWGLGYGESPVGTFRSISAGWWHACGIRSDSTLSCWGSPSSLGDVEMRASFQSVVSGNEFACALAESGAVLCWGWLWPETPAGRFTTITAGVDHACGLRADGKAECWGNEVEERGLPTDVAFTAIAAGWEHSCGITTDGGVRCRGWLPVVQPICLDEGWPCGRPLSGNGSPVPTAADALAILRSAVGVGRACIGAPCQCDLDANGGISTTDALRALRASVGLLDASCSCA